MEFSDELFKHGVYDADLHNGTLKAFISPSRNTKVGAVVKLWVSNSSHEESGQYLEGINPEVIDTENKIEVHFTAEQLRPYTSNKVYFGYNIDGGVLSSTVPLYINISPR